MGARFVSISTKEIVYRDKLMRTTMSHTYTFALIVGTRKVRFFSTLKWSAGKLTILQKVILRKNEQVWVRLIVVVPMLPELLPILL